MTNPNQRKYQRLPLVRKIILTPFNSEKTYEGKILNISINGILIDLLEILPINQECALTILLEEESQTQKIQTNAIVIHLNQGIGLQFTAMPVESYQLLKALIQYNSDYPDNINEEIQSYMMNSMDEPNNGTTETI